MTLYLFSDNQNTVRKFDAVERGRKFSLSILSVSELDKYLKKDAPDGIFYLDISKIDVAKSGKYLSALSRQKGSAYGIIDPEGKIKDVAALFHDGASDYLGKLSLQGGIDGKRISKVIAYAGRNIQTEIGSNHASSELDNFISSGKGWKSVKPGNEYTFCFMFVELDLTYEWKNKSGKIHLSKVSSDFLKFIQKAVDPLSGNIWLWGEFGGIILFPFDGQSADAVIMCFKLILGRTISSVEDFNYSTPVSIRIALDIGNTVYQKRGETGAIVSDTINFMFHLGKRFLPPGNFYLTDKVVDFIPKGMENCFRKAGKFENVNILRMLLPAE